MKNFDESRTTYADDDLAFVLGGEQFSLKPAVRPEVLVPYEDLTGEEGAAGALAVTDDLILSCLNGDKSSEKRYREVRAREENPITLGDLRAVIRWIYEVQTGRPTTPPASSTRGRSTSGQSSKES